MKNLKKYKVLAGMLFIFILFNIFLFFFDAQKIVDWVGVKNTYLVVFVIATVGGLSTLTGPILFTSIATFAGGGANIFLLGLLGGLGIFISDSIFYAIAKLGVAHVPEKWEIKLKKVEEWMRKFPDWSVLTVVYIYLSFTPLPTDLLMIALAASGYKYKKIVWVILAGSLTIALLTAYLGETFIL